MTVRVSHVAAAHADPKMEYIIKKHGAAGYGVIWFLVEKMRLDSDGYILPEYFDLWSDVLNAPVLEIVKTAIHIKLFSEDENGITAPYVQRDIENLLRKQEGWRNRQQKHRNVTRDNIHKVCDSEEEEEGEIEEEPEIESEEESEKNQKKNPEKNQKKNPEKKTKITWEFVESIMPEPLTRPDALEAFKEFYNYRREIRKPFKTKKALSLIFNQFGDKPDDLIKSIRESIKNEYQGLFKPPRDPPDYKNEQKKTAFKKNMALVRAAEMEVLK